MNAEAPILELLSHTALKGAAVLVVALLAGLALQKLAAARRYAIWITAVTALAVLPLAMALLPAWHVLPQATAELPWPVAEPVMLKDGPAQDLTAAKPLKASVPLATTTAVALAPLPAKATISWQEVFSMLPTLWISMAVLLLLRLGWSAWRLHRLERRLQTGTSELLAKTAQEIGLKRLPRLLLGPADAVPMVWGVWQTRLLLPQDFAAWPQQKLRGVLLHELAHLKRGDPLALWIAQWVKALHWFNPLAWLTIRQLGADQERACDDTVLRLGVRASDYAQSLLDLSRHSRIAPGLALCALTITRCAPVEARVQAILDPNRRREPITPRWLACMAGFSLLITLPVAMLHAIEGPKLRGRILDRNGVVLAESTVEKARVYPLKTLAAHVIGYTRMHDFEDRRLRGGAGVEKQEDSTLTAGKDVALSLDLRIQSLTHRAMTEAGVTRGAAVVLDPRTGEILAMVSLPSYDGNTFIPSISLAKWKALLADRDIPLMLRAVRGYSPGSCFMPLTALAGISAGITGQKFTCNGEVTYGKSVMQCWINRQSGEHGALSMAEALAVGCSCYWYQFGNAAGIEQMESMGHKLGFGTGYDLFEDEGKGILPSPTWMKEHRPMQTWSAAWTANTSIGSGLVEASPLQLAVLAATVGNGGKIPQPVMLKKNGENSWRADLIADGLPAAQIEQLREGMRLVVNGDSGTGQAARSEKVMIAGKTGTAQNSRLIDGKLVGDNHTWFIGFAPFDQPTLAFAILKQGGKSGGGDCGPIAKRIVEEALALPADGSGEVKPMEAKGATAQAKFDFEAAETSRQIKLRATELKIYMKEFKMDSGQVTILGEASGMIQALQFRDRLIEIGRQRQLEWTLPVLKAREDGVVEFRANGNANSTYRVVIPGQEPRIVMAPEDSKSASQGQIRQQSDAAIRMRPVDAGNS